MSRSALRRFIPTLLIGALALVPATAWADGAEPDSPIEPIETVVVQPEPEVEIVVRPEDEPERVEVEVRAPASTLTACEQLRVAIFETRRNIAGDKAADRWAAYQAMRAGDPTARYLCLSTTCTPERLNMLGQRLASLHEERYALNERIAQGPLGASDDCQIFHMVLRQEMLEMMWGHDGPHYRVMRKHKRDRKDRDDDRAGADDRQLTRYEEEQAIRLERRRAVRGY